MTGRTPRWTVAESVWCAAQRTSQKRKRQESTRGGRGREGVEVSCVHAKSTHTRTNDDHEWFPIRGGWEKVFGQGNPRVVTSSSTVNNNTAVYDSTKIYTHVTHQLAGPGVGVEAAAETGPASDALSFIL